MAGGPGGQKLQAQVLRKKAAGLPRPPQQVRQLTSDPKSWMVLRADDQARQGNAYGYAYAAFHAVERRGRNRHGHLRKLRIPRKAPGRVTREQ